MPFGMNYDVRYKTCRNSPTKCMWRWGDSAKFRCIHTTWTFIRSPYIIFYFVKCWNQCFRHISGIVNTFGSWKDLFPAEGICFVSPKNKRAERLKLNLSAPCSFDALKLSLLSLYCYLLLNKLCCYSAAVSLCSYVCSAIPYTASHPG